MTGSPTIDAHQALFDNVGPLLGDADVTAGNLETVLSAAPFVDPAVGGPGGPARPFPLHPKKDYVFASHPNAPWPCAGPAAAARSHAVVVFMVHGGFEYGAEPSLAVRRMTAAAREAGAVLVANHHPHVLGGLDWHNGTLAAMDDGQLRFRPQVWPTFPSGLLTVQLSEGKVVRAYLEPVLSAGLAPAALTGTSADRVSRGRGRSLDRPSRCPPGRRLWSSTWPGRVASRRRAGDGRGCRRRPGMVPDRSSRPPWSRPSRSRILRRRLRGRSALR